MIEPVYDAVVIGGGFFGCSLALYLKKTGIFSNIVLIEKEKTLMQKASYINQARVHRGYHYPRSIVTALRSNANFNRFVQEYDECIERNFSSYYAIARGSNVSSVQFKQFCMRIGAPLEQVKPHIRAFFNETLIEDVFEVQEYVFNADKIRNKITDQLLDAHIEILYNADAKSLSKEHDKVVIIYEHNKSTQLLKTRYVFNCAYTHINKIYVSSGLPLVKLKQERTEIALVEVPTIFKNKAITIMCGPYFSLMPFPPRDIHTLTHVRYTPYAAWQEGEESTKNMENEQMPINSLQSQFLHMQRDAARYVPDLNHCVYKESLWQTKTTLPQNEYDDGRPILFNRSAVLPCVFSILGSKMDTVFDMFEEIDNVRSTFVV